MTGNLLLILRLALAVVLFTFIGWAFWLLWRDLKSQADLLASPRIPELTLTPLDSSGIPSRSFRQPALVIGREPGCDLQLTDSTVSSQHARLSYHHSQWWLQDLGSRNGTFLNEEPVTIPAVLTDRDELRLGGIRLKVGLPSIVG